LTEAGVQARLTAAYHSEKILEECLTSAHTHVADLTLEIEGLNKKLNADAAGIKEL